MAGKSHQPNQLELSGERLALYRALSRRSERIAQIYLGAHLALRDSANPERFCLSAHEFRELMEKVPEIVDVTTQAHKENMGDKIQQLDVAYDRAVSNVPLPIKDWSGALNQHVARFLEELRDFFEWKKINNPSRRREIASTFRALDGPGRALPPDLENAAVESWLETKRFFLSVAHHQLEPTLDQFEEQARRIEGLLLQKLNPQTFAEFDVLDSIIDEGETNDQR